MDDHSSATLVTKWVKLPTRASGLKVPAAVFRLAPKPARARPLFGIAPGGACHTVPVARSVVGSYPTVSPSPCPSISKPSSLQGSLFSVALSLGLPRPGITRHPIFMEPGLSSSVATRDHPAIRTKAAIGPGRAAVNAKHTGPATKDAVVFLPRLTDNTNMLQIDTLAANDSLQFFDSQSLLLAKPLTAYQAWCGVMAAPLPLLRTAFAIRDAISARFGVRRIGGFGRPPVDPPKAGDHLDFFLVERSEPDILTLIARDRHLDVMTCITTRDQTLKITSSVITHNRFGRAYMLPVAPAHRLIVWLMLRRLAKSLRTLA